MTSTVFVSGTTIASTWLNDVNTSTYTTVPSNTAALATINGATGAANVGYTPAGTGAVATTVQTKLRQVVSIMDFMTAAQITDVLAGTRTLDLQSVLQTAVNTCIANGTALCIPSTVKSMRVDSPVTISYATLGTKTLSIFGDAVNGYYQGGMGSEIYYAGTTGYLFQIEGRPADVGGSNEGSPMPVTFQGINFAGTTNAFGAISFFRSSFGRVLNNNFYGFAKTSTGVIVLNAGSVTVGSPTSFAGEITIEGNYFASSGRCVLMTGASGAGVINMVRITNNVMLDQDYGIACDFGAGVPYSESIWITGNHFEGTLTNDIYSQGVATNWVIERNYIEQNNPALNTPRVNIAGSNNLGIVIEDNLFSKDLSTAAAGSTVISIVNTNNVLIRNNSSNYGGLTTVYSSLLTGCSNATVEPFASLSLPAYSCSFGGYVFLSGPVSSGWYTLPVNLGISSGDGYPGGTVCTVVAESSKTNAMVTVNMKATITTKSTSGTSTLIGVLPYYNYGKDVYFPVYTTNVTGTAPFYGVVGAGTTVCTIYNAAGVALNYQTAVSVGSIFVANFSYLTQD